MEALRSADIEQFRRQIRELLDSEEIKSRIIRRPRHAHVYTCGIRDSSVYFVESGRIKMMSLSPEGKECLVAIYTAGDVFGELSLCGQTIRYETAVAMKDSVLRQIASSDFLSALRCEPSMSFLKYMVARLGEQQQVISSLLTVNSEHRLAHTLLRLARDIGKPDPRLVQIDQKMSHEELAAMVGTTRTRIGIFLKKFRRLGLIDISPERYIIIKPSKLAEYADGLQPSQEAGQEREQQMRSLLRSADQLTPPDLTLSLRKVV